MTLEILRPADLQSCQCCHLLDKSRVHRGVELQGRAVTVGEVAQSPTDQLLLLRIKVLEEVVLTSQYNEGYGKHSNVGGIQVIW